MFGQSHFPLGKANLNFGETSWNSSDPSSQSFWKPKDKTTNTFTFRSNEGRAILEPIVGLALVSWSLVAETFLNPELVGGALKEGGFFLICLIGAYFYRRDFRNSLAELRSDRELLIDVVNKNTEALTGVKDVVHNCANNQGFPNRRH